MNSNSLTASVVLAISLTLSASPVGASVSNIMLPPQSVEYQTTSLNFVADDFANEFTIGHAPKALKNDAFDLFGEQSNFSPDELKTYWAALKKDSVDVGVNIFDLFE